MSVSPIKGQFLWRDLNTADPDKAVDFYTQLFGWTVTVNDLGEGNIYRMLKNNDVPFGGIVGLSEIGIPESQGVPPHWVSYIVTPDVDATVARVTELGGTIYSPPMDIPDVGRFAVAADPKGGAFAVIATQKYGVDPSAEVPMGGVVWNELLTSDIEGAKSFYTDLFGYGSSSQSVEGYGQYDMFSIPHDGKDESIAGMGAKPENMPTSAWGIYIRVENIDETRARIAELGGENHSEVMEVEGTGRMSVVVDPTGAYFSILQPSPR